MRVILYHHKNDPSFDIYIYHMIIIKIYWLVVEPNPSENMTSSVGYIVPNIWKNKSHVPNHQPDYYPVI